MKQLSSLLILVLFFSCDYSQKANKQELIKDDTLFVYNDNGTLAFKAPIKNAIKNGEAYSYDKDGKLIAITNYVNDTIQGFVNEYYPSGILKSEAYYLNGKKFTEYHEYFDGYQDSTAIKRDGKWWIVPFPTRVKKYEFYDLREKVMYYRYYDEEGNLTDRKGRLFQAKLNGDLFVSIHDTFIQGWITPSPYTLKQLKIEQYYVISNVSDYGFTNDTIHSDSDSTVTRWKYKITKPGGYKFKAVAYLHENGTVETDTSYFKVIVKE